jgi:hypothetical protein
MPASQSSHLKLPSPIGVAPLECVIPPTALIRDAPKNHTRKGLDRPETLGDLPDLILAISPPNPSH